jgi:hypothetical protein
MPSGAAERREAAKSSSAVMGGGDDAAQRLADQVGGQGGEADPGRHPRVVLEDAERAVRPADHVEPGEADPERKLHSSQVGLDELAVLEHPGRDDPRLDDSSLAVGVGEEGVERPHPLGEPPLEQVPLLGGEQARHGIDHEGVRPRGAVAGSSLDDPCAHPASSAARSVPASASTTAR